MTLGKQPGDRDISSFSKSFSRPGWRPRSLPSVPPVSQDDPRTSPGAAKGPFESEAKSAELNKTLPLEKTLKKTSEVPGKETLNCPKPSETS